jgi:F-type H+-transporting ATPase subunit gamma
MPSLIDIRRRVRSVKNTQQITKAMKMVSAAKLRRAQERVIAARPYAAMLEKMLASVSGAARGTDMAGELPLLAVRPEKRVQLILVTADRGLAGGFNTNLIKAAQRFLAEHAGHDVVIEAVGRKGRDFFAKRAKLSGEHIGLVNKVAKLTYAETQAVTQRVTERFINGEIDSVYLIYNEFKSVMTQKLTETKLLPIEMKDAGDAPQDYIYEQSPDVLLGTLLPKYLENSVYRAILESIAAEQAARMTAMDSASSNAADVINKLTLYMNRVRQASITKEIIEVVSGAAALE